MTRFALGIRVGLSIMAIVLNAPSLYALACPICYGANSTQTIEALKKGYIFLLFPPLFILGGISYLAYKKRNHSDKMAEKFRTVDRKAVAVKTARTSTT